MNNTGKIVLMGLAAIFMLVAFYAFIEWFTILSKDSHSLIKSQGSVSFDSAEKTGLFLLSMFVGSFAFGVISFIAYRHRRRFEGF